MLCKNAFLPFNQQCQSTEGMTEASVSSGIFFSSAITPILVTVSVCQ